MMEFATWKALPNLFYVPFIWVMIYLNMDSEIISLFAVLMLLDMVTGVAKARKLEIKTTMKRFMGGMFSKILLLIIPFVLAILAKVLHVDSSILLFIVIDALILSEAYSIFSNIYTVRTGRVAEEFDVLHLILAKTRSFTINMLGGESNEKSN